MAAYLAAHGVGTLDLVRIAAYAGAQNEECRPAVIFLKRIENAVGGILARPVVKGKRDIFDSLGQVWLFALGLGGSLLRRRLAEQSLSGLGGKDCLYIARLEHRLDTALVFIKKRAGIKIENEAVRAYREFREIFLVCGGILLEFIRADARIKQAVVDKIRYDSHARKLLVAVREEIVRAQKLAGRDIKDKRLYRVRLYALVGYICLYLKNHADIFVLAVVRDKIALVIGAQGRLLALGF